MLSQTAVGCCGGQRIKKENRMLGTKRQEQTASQQHTIQPARRKENTLTTKFKISTIFGNTLTLPLTPIQRRSVPVSGGYDG